MAFFIAGLACVTCASELAVGDCVPAFSAKDQFGKEAKLGPSTRFLLLGLDMAISKAANIKLDALKVGWLEQHHAAYVLDTRPIPALAWPFALRKLKQYRHRIMISTDKSLSAFPRKTERITVLTLTANNRIQEIRYWNPMVDSLDSLLK